MNDTDHSEQQLADALTEEPVVFMGCTGSEMMLVIVCSVVPCLFIGLVVGLILISLSPSLALLGGFVVAFGGSFVVALLALHQLQATKEQNGNLYYREQIALFMTGMGIGDPVITRSQRYSRGRSL